MNWRSVREVYQVIGRTPRFDHDGLKPTVDEGGSRRDRVSTFLSIAWCRMYRELLVDEETEQACSECPFPKKARPAVNP